ncbi:MAG: UvrA family protein, partial [Dermatophilaceae bacterium]
MADVPEVTVTPPRYDHDRLVVRGAREHNLRDISVDLPRNSLIVFTGLSGSGKSSLAFDTIFAEGQRRYVESLSAYARQFLGQMDKPDVDFIEGLSPAVSIDQKSTNRNPRSTVGTITEVYDYLRLLFARAGRPHCPVCGEAVTRQSPQQIVDRLLELPELTRFQVLAPVVQARKGEFVDLFSELQTKGFSRARVDGEVISLIEPPTLEKQKKHTIEIVIDRLVAKGDDTGAKRRLTDSVETALALTSGVLIVDFVDLDPKDDGRERRYSEKMACPNNHPLAMDEVEPRSFSFNSPFGACPKCTGLGTELEVDPELLIPDEDLSINEGAIAPWAQGSGSAEYFLRVLTALGEDLKFGLDKPWHSLPDRAREAILHGQNYKVHVKYRNRYGRDRSYTTGFEGVVPFVKRRHSETDSEWSRERYEGYMREVPCPECGGARLKPESLAVQIGGQSISAICALAIADCAKFLAEVDFSSRERQIAERVIKEIEARLGFL